MRKYPKCNKCHRSPIEYIEEWNGHSISFLVDNNNHIEKEGVMEVGEPIRVRAVCACGHIWVLRGVNQITQIRSKINGAS